MKKKHNFSVLIEALKHELYGVNDIRTNNMSRIYDIFSGFCDCEIDLAYVIKSSHAAIVSLAEGLEQFSSMIENSPTIVGPMLALNPTTCRLSFYTSVKFIISF